MKLLLILTAGIGNSIMAAPALTALRRCAAGPHMVLAGHRENLALFPPGEWCDESVAVPGNKSLLRFFLEHPALLRRYDAAICFYASGDGRLKWLQKLGLIGKVITYRDLPDCGRGEPESRIDGRLLQSIDVIDRLGDDRADLLLSDREIAVATGILREHRIDPETAVCIHPGWSTPPRTKALPPTLVEQLIAEIQKRDGVPFLLLGPQEREYWRRQDSPALRDCAVFPAEPALRILGAMLGQLRGVIAADTGMGHLAAACGGRLVSVFGPTSSIRCAPRGIGSVVIVRNSQLDCLGCEEAGRQCEKNSALCISSLCAGDIVKTLWTPIG